MKRHIFALGAAAGLSVFSASAMAAAQPSNAQLISQIQKISQQTAELQGEVRSLKAQLKHKQRHAKKHKRSVSHVSHPEVLVGGPSIYRPIVTVTTSPWMGLRTHFRPMDILERQGSMNEDLYLLQRRQHFIHELEAAGLHLDRPMVQISGGVEGQVVQDDIGNGSINLSSVEFDVNAVASSWANAFFTFDYDNSPASTGNREPNGRIFLQRGFLTIGNLDRTPFYFSIGQMYAPFGKYSSWMLTTPLEESMARILTRTMLLGFSSNGIYVQAYAFSGDRLTGNSGVLKQGGLNFGVDHTFRSTDIDVGFGVVSNMADSQGMQNNGLETLNFFNGFGFPAQVTNLAGNTFTVTNLDNLRHNVPGADGHVEISYKPFTFVAEYLSATQNFDPRDMTFNFRGALPHALHTEIDLDFAVSWINFKLVGVYDQAWQGLALNLPRQSFAVALLTSLWKDTAEGIEFRHNEAYPIGTFATGGTINGIPVPFPVSNGQDSNIITAQIGVYF